MHPFQKIYSRWLATDSMAGVGLDPDQLKILNLKKWGKNYDKDIAGLFFHFCKEIIDSTSAIAVDYKVNPSFFLGPEKSKALVEVFKYLRKTYPEIIRVCDGKFADVSNTAEKIAEYVFDELNADAVLLNPYLGNDALIPFTKREDKISLVCISTSNDSANDVQGLRMKSGLPLWRSLLKKVMNDWNINGNIVPVLSATRPTDLIGIREIIGEVPILLAGVGAQGGDLDRSVPPLLDKNGYGLLISSSRAIIYPTLDEGESLGDAAFRELFKLKNMVNLAKTKAHSYA